MHCFRVIDPYPLEFYSQFKTKYKTVLDQNKQLVYKVKLRY